LISDRHRHQKAADQGNADAQYNLGRMYGIGEGIPQDLVVAHMWINLSAVDGDPTAAKLREAVARLMTPGR
jgi:TPR repeat protein